MFGEYSQMTGLCLFEVFDIAIATRETYIANRMKKTEGVGPAIRYLNRQINLLYFPVTQIQLKYLIRSYKEELGLQ